MQWARGLTRLRTVAIVLLGIGLVTALSSILMSGLGYQPDPGFLGIFTLLTHLSVPCILLGGVLWAAVWVLEGFLPAGAPRVRPPR